MLQDLLVQIQVADRLQHRVLGMGDLHGIGKGTAGVFRCGVQLLQDIRFLLDPDATLHTKQQLCRGQRRFPGKGKDLLLRRGAFDPAKEPGDIPEPHLPFQREQQGASKPGKKPVLNGGDGQRSQKMVQGPRRSSRFR